MSNWFHCFSPKLNATLRLFCFHYGGGGASAFRDWHELLPHHVEVICVQFPGRESRFPEPLISDLNEICSQIIKEIQPYLNKPFVFFGHSLGALITHHVSARLMNCGLRTPETIIVSGRSAPQDDEVYYKKITHLPDDEFVENLKEYGGTPELILENTELMNVYVPILRSDFLVSESKERVPGKVSFPIAVFGGFQDKMSEQKLSQWQHETTKSCSVTMFSGNHFFINQNKDEVLKTVAELLANVTNTKQQNASFLMK
ncbi:hypothetical protein A5320_18080 [Rheinheimera sp. SA_1]|uniref:thioesterase II family protein n=1 Tax=Rheinheimera sp. SA_1 TaxID=1827365 RepID=UPI000800012F|nr:alpha/beta fold hydrolase [Rheinheimera sp. SA_1]OBP13464.1 hypothetical protein A5320_18080 [Rheinheimera sp. SA_1]